MPLYALVELATMAVVNVASSPTTSAASVPVAPPGFRNILEGDWTPGNTPHVNDIWDGTIPAMFSAPPPVEDVPGDVPTAVANVRDAQAELDRRLTQLDALLGTSG
jgi:hypothetical protein